MLRMIALALTALPGLCFGQVADEEFCANLATIESLSEPDIHEFARSADEYVAALIEKLADQTISTADILPGDWAKHGLQVQMASCYISGKGTARGINKAVTLLEKPAEAGYPQAVHTLASLRLFRSADDSLQRLGFRALEQEYESGSAFAAGKLGWAYQKGLGVEQDLNKALELYQYAARSGMTYWQYLLAHAYEKGYLGLAEDAEKAAYWVAFKPKVHVALYECWVAAYYADGTFPANDEIRAQYQETCDETDLGEWWANFRTK